MKLHDKLIYKNYISTHFNNLHKKQKNDFPIFYRYFKKNYLRHLPSNRESKILDIGCGMGHFLYFLKKENYKNYLGIDASEECVQFCRKKGFNVEHTDAIRFFEENNEPFDIIILNDIIEHWNAEEVIKMLGIINKNLNTKGSIIIKVINMANPILGVHGRYGDFSHKIGFTEESLSQILKISDFKNIKVLPQNIYIYYYNPFNYLAMIISKIINLLLKILFIIYGRKNTKIFTKSIIAIGQK